MPELITDSDKYTDNLLQEKDKTKVKNFITFYNAQVNEPEKYAKEKTNLDKIKANLDELLIPNADTSAILRKLDSITKLEPPTRKKSIVGGVIEKAAEAAEKAARNAYQTAKTASSKFNKSSVANLFCKYCCTFSQNASALLSCNGLSMLSHSLIKSNRFCNSYSFSCSVCTATIIESRVFNRS